MGRDTPLKKRRSFFANIKTYYHISAAAHTLGLFNSLSKSCEGLLHTRGRIKSVFLQNIPVKGGTLGCFPGAKGFLLHPLCLGGGMGTEARMDDQEKKTLCRPGR